MDSLANAGNNQTVDYSEVLPKVGCFGFTGVILLESHKSQAIDPARSILLKVAGGAKT